MNQMAFVAAAYLLTGSAIGALIIRSWIKMRRAEGRLDAAIKR